ncbi:hypothetical protein BOW18_12220, partial [Solemya velum gill symbiont]|uniref:hypothetical protein n=1 Tax=Solemya velum gill symbiont TaxID=2340 RepID=UPI0009CF5527
MSTRPVAPQRFTDTLEVVADQGCVQIVNGRRIIDPGVIVAHEDALKKGNDALYPFAKSIVKTYAVPQGQFAFYVDDLFQGRVPHRLIVGLVSSNAVNGTYTKNPFNFEPFDCNKVGFYVDGQSVPSQPLQPNYSAEQYTEAYDTLKKAGGRAVDIWRL